MFDQCIPYRFLIKNRLYVYSIGVILLDIDFSANAIDNKSRKLVRLECFRKTYRLMSKTIKLDSPFCFPVSGNVIQAEWDTVSHANEIFKRDFIDEIKEVSVEIWIKKWEYLVKIILILVQVQSVQQLQTSRRSNIINAVNLENDRILDIAFLEIHDFRIKTF